MFANLLIALREGLEAALAPGGMVLCVCDARLWWVCSCLLFRVWGLRVRMGDLRCERVCWRSGWV